MIKKIYIGVHVQGPSLSNFIYKHLLQNFFILRKTEQDMVKKIYIGVHVQGPSLSNFIYKRLLQNFAF